MPLAPADHISTRFTPVPIRARADGWTEARQRGFIRALALGATVGTAASSVGMSRESAYRLHARPHARSFRRAWRVAMELARAIPEPTPDWRGRLIVHRWKKRVVHVERRVNDSRLRLLLRRHWARIERETRARHPAELTAWDARKSYSRGVGPADRCANFVTFGERSSPTGRGYEALARQRPGGVGEGEPGFGHPHPSGAARLPPSPTGRGIIPPPLSRAGCRGVP